MQQVIGVISDTHGLLRPQATDALAGVDLIIHAGDVGDPAILEQLRQIAPVHVVRGNVDYEEWTEALPETAVVQIGDVLIYVLHDRAELDLNPAAANFAAVIFGHSHQPLIEEDHGVVYLNPGSAGPRRFHLPVSVAKIQIQDKKLTATLIELTV